MERRDPRERWLVAGLLLLGAALRFVLLGDLPAGLNQDEASAGYEAWALLTSGMDRAGNSWPVLFVSWGSGQNALYSYLTIPFVLLFGLSTWSIRLTAALFGTLSLPLFQDLAARLFGRRAGLWALALLSVNPWHVMASRWALESNLLPFFLLLGVWCLLRGMERPAFLLGAGASFALCLYAYGTAFFLLPVFLVAAFFLLLRRGALRLWWTLGAVALFALMAAPIAVCQLRNALDLPGVTWGAITLPQLTEARQLATSVFGGGSIQSNVRALLTALLQGDPYRYNTLPGFGLFYPFGLVLAAVSVVQLLRRRLRPAPGFGLALAWLGSGLLCALLIDGNVNRLNLLWLPLLLLQAPALDQLTQGTRWRTRAAALVLAVSAALFSLAYSQQAKHMVVFYRDLESALQTAQECTDGVILVTDQINMPYIFVLFYEQIPPEQFVQLVEFNDPDHPFRRPLYFGRWRFGDDPQPGECYLSFAPNGWSVELIPMSGYTLPEEE